jgi:hypothetical protein
MTTRETTAYMPLHDLDLKLSLGDRVMVMAYGAVQWPWLLRSLDGGRKKDKTDLLAYLGLPTCVQRKLLNLAAGLPPLSLPAHCSFLVAGKLSALTNMRPSWKRHKAGSMTMIWTQTSGTPH